MYRLMTQLIQKATMSFFVLILVASSAIAGEGMWLPFLLKSLNETEMKSMGMKMSADDIYSVNHGSLKDAVIHFGGFCTGEVVSDLGLVLTNHHCGYDAIQTHSTLEKNYIKNGFWAKNLGEELPTPGLFATFIIRIDDVSAAALQGITSDMDPSARQSAIDKNLNIVKQQAAKEPWQDVSVRSFFEGTQYFLFVTETYNDVRFVGSPPESIGKFGADTDNWVWPRHTGDFSVFRIYASPDNKPAAYSPDNKPMKPRHFFPVSLDGIEEGDFTMVFGFPGRTNQYLPSFAVAQTADIIDPVRIGVRDISLGVMDKHMRKDEDIRLAYSSKYAGISNSWKKWIGEVLGLKTKNAVSVIEKEESEFSAIIQKDKQLRKEYEHILPEMKTLYQALDPIVKDRFLLSEVLGGSNVEIFLLTSYADRLVKAYEASGDQGFATMVARIEPELDGFFKDYRVHVDQELFSTLTAHVSENLTPSYLPEAFSGKQANLTFEAWANEVYDQTILIKKDTLIEVMQMGGALFSKVMQNDAAYQAYLALKKVMDEKLSPGYNDINKKLQVLQQQYVTALIRAYPDKRFWPDANSTLRVSYGQVEPYAPRDGMAYKTQTYLDGIMEKYKPNDYEFDVHPKLIDLYDKKDYGQYGENGKMPVCFIASNHTTGGNSGSPAVDAYGNLIGINFDRVWEGTMSDLYYDKSICRNIMVDIRYVLFVIDKFAGATHLIKEMKLVHPKS